MSALTKKQQKAQAFRSKQKAKKSGKPLPDDVPEADIDVDVEGDEAGAEGGSAGVGKLGQDGTSIAETSGSANGKKRKRGAEEEGEGETKAKTKQTDLSGGAKGQARSIGKGKGKWDEDEEGGEKKKSKKEIKQRFILFIGNLGFKTTANDVSEHFKEALGLAPQVRLLTTKPTRAGQPPKSRGIAFLEVPTSEAMQAALKLHHTTLASRRINVELTAGGGGKSNERASKIKERNDRVGVQRGKRAEKEREEAEKNGTLNKDEENVNGFKPQGFGGHAKGDKAEVIKTRGPVVGQKPMRAWGQAGAASASGGAEGLNATSTPPAPAVKRVQEDQSHVQGVSDGSVKVRGGRRVKVNPNGKPGNSRPPRPRWEPTGPNATPVG